MYQKLITTLVKRYSFIDSPEELTQLADIAIWEALSKSEVVTTSFVRRAIIWKFLSVQKKSKSFTIKNNYNLNNTAIPLIDLVDCLSEKEKSVFGDKFIGGLTLKEISVKHSLSVSAVSREIEKIARKIKKDLTSEY